MSQQEKYKEEFEKYKDVFLPIEYMYYVKSNPRTQYKLKFNNGEVCHLEHKDGHTILKTGHWCRKNLLRI